MCNKLHNICILSGKDFPQDLPVLRQHAVKLRGEKMKKIIMYQTYVIG